MSAYKNNEFAAVVRNVFKRSTGLYSAFEAAEEPESCTMHQCFFVLVHVEYSQSRRKSAFFLVVHFVELFLVLLAARVVRLVEPLLESAFVATQQFVVVAVAAHAIDRI